MFVTIILGLLVLAGLLIIAFGPRVKTTQYADVKTGETDRWGTSLTKREYKTVSSKPVALIPLGLAFLIAVFVCTVQIPAKQVGVVTEFGKPQEHTLSAGLHKKAPWQGVTEIDATWQPDEFRGDDCITVILADKNTACISATIRWAVNEKNANDVYADFRSDDPTKELRDSLVSTQFKAALGQVFSTYDATTTEGQPTQDELSKQAYDVMLTKTKGLVDIDSVTISYIKPSEKVQAKIDAIQAQKAETNIAEEKKLTATAEAAANKILSDSISNDPNVLVSKCLDLVAEGDANLPAGFQCWNGNSSSVVIPSGK